MADKTGIEWTDATWNPIRGCSRVSEACRHCYAEPVAARFSGPGMPYEGLAKRVGGEARWTGEVRLIEHMLDQPLRWKKPRRIFVNSMSDLFHEKVPDEWIDRIFAVMALAPQHIFQILTKRPERMKAYCSTIQKYGRWLNMEEIALRLGYEPRGRDDYGFDWISNKQFLPNVWLGVSIEDQKTADERIPILLDTPAAKRFTSAEPLLGPIDLSAIDINGHLEIFPLQGTWQCEDMDGSPVQEIPALDWVICGGESGRGARPMRLQWARSLRDQCAAAGVPFFFKQWGEWLPDKFCGELVDFDDECPGPELHGYAYHEEADCWRVGKRNAGRLLDGVEHKGFPASAKPAKGIEP